MTLEHYEEIWRQQGREVTDLNRRGMRIGLRNRSVARVSLAWSLLAVVAASVALVSNPFFVALADLWATLCLLVSIGAVAASALALYVYTRMLMGTVTSSLLGGLAPALAVPAIASSGLGALAMITFALEPGGWLAGVLAVLLLGQTVLLFLCGRQRAPLQ